MEFTVSSPAKKQNQTLPPRRGQIKIRIIKRFLDSVTSMALTAKQKPRKKKESAANLSSCSTTTAPTPTGYNSDGSLN